MSKRKELKGKSGDGNKRPDDPVDWLAEHSLSDEEAIKLLSGEVELTSASIDDMESMNPDDFKPVTDEVLRECFKPITDEDLQPADWPDDGTGPGDSPAG